ASAVAAQAATFSKSGLSNQLVLVNGSLGFVSRRPDGRVFSIVGFTIAGGKVVEIDSLADPASQPTRSVGHRRLSVFSHESGVDFTDLSGVPSFVGTDEQEPLIPVHTPDRGMCRADVA